MLRLPLAAIVASLSIAVFTTSALAQCEVSQFTDGIPGGPQDDFGRAVAMEGDVLAIGGAAGFVPGIVRIYRRDGYEWVEEATFTAPDAMPFDVFGTALALSGDYLVVGSYDSELSGFQSGAAYVYRYDRVCRSWDLETILFASDAAHLDRFGFSVAIDHDPLVLVVGARSKDSDDGLASAGAAYVYRHDGAKWIEEQKLLDPKPAASDLFGASCALENDLVVIGGNGNFGEAWVFRYAENEWQFESSLLPSNPDLVLWFGWSVDLRGDRIVVGAAFAHDGYAFLYESGAQASDWEYRHTFLPTNPVGVSGFFGHRVRFGETADTVFVSAIMDSEAAGQAGAVYIFHEEESGWTDGIKVMPADPIPGGGLGAGLDVSGDLMAAGAPNGAAGGVFVFAGVNDADCNANDEPDGCVFSSAKVLTKTATACPMNAPPDRSVTLTPTAMWISQTCSCCSTRGDRVSAEGALPIWTVQVTSGSPI